MTTRAEFPSGARALVQYRSGLLARAAYLNLYQLLPVARTVEAIGDLFGCSPSPATVESGGRRISGKLVRCEQCIKAAIRDSRVVGADETGLRVAGSLGWVHVARTDELIHFAYDARRGRDSMNSAAASAPRTGRAHSAGCAPTSRLRASRATHSSAHLSVRWMASRWRSPRRET